MNIYKLRNYKYVLFICGIISVKYLFINNLAFSNGTAT